MNNPTNNNHNMHNLLHPVPPVAPWFLMRCLQACVISFSWCRCSTSAVAKGKEQISGTVYLFISELIRPYKCLKHKFFSLDFHLRRWFHLLLCNVQILKYVCYLFSVFYIYFFIYLLSYFNPGQYFGILNLWTNKLWLDFDLTSSGRSRLGITD